MLLATSSYPYWSVVPFVSLLLSIAIIPLIAESWWHSNRNKAVVGLIAGVPVALFVATRDLHALVHTGLEYAAFLALLGSLYAISGGIRVRGSVAGTPLSNTGLLAVGAVLANLIGTTGASMVLIRPYLEANRDRVSKTHLVVFFIFIVSNLGGCLTPLGDPPLFLGFLKGVPFTWTLSLWPQFLVTTLALLFFFNLIDQRMFNREDRADPRDLVDVVQPRAPIRISGGVNVALLILVMGTIIAGGVWVAPRWGGTASQVFQIGALGLLGFLSVMVTPRPLREENKFSWHPFIEVMVLFGGIFASMIPALAILNERGAELNLSHPASFFWATGSLSAFLDNAPTYLAFLSMAQYLPDQTAGTTNAALAAISCGAVFFGAMTYIGNGPNFMVKAIAEQLGVKMPSFLGYMKWSVAILIPLFIAVTFMFFS